MLLPIASDESCICRELPFQGPRIVICSRNEFGWKRWSTCAVFEDFLEELAFGKELLEEESSETNACVVVRSGLLNPPFQFNKSHTTTNTFFVSCFDVLIYHSHR